MDEWFPYSSGIPWEGASQAEVFARQGKTGVNFYRVFKMYDGLLKIPPLGQNVAEVVMYIGIVWSQLYRFFVMSDRFFWLADQR